MANYLSWTKEHQKEIINRIINDASLAPSGKPMAIFMAGLPGAGKTELSLGLSHNFNRSFIRIDMDDLATMIEGYKPENADLFRGAATRLLDALFDKTIKNRFDFVMDGTFGSSKAVQDINRVLKRGYVTSIIYVFQDPKVAWNFTIAREKIEHRSIDKEGFLDVYYKTIDNLHKVADTFGDKVSINLFIKNKRNRLEKMFIGMDFNLIEKEINFIYNKDELRKYIES